MSERAVGVGMWRERRPFVILFAVLHVPNLFVKIRYENFMFKHAIHYTFCIHVCLLSHDPISVKMNFLKNNG